MSKFNKSYRIRTEVGKDTNIHVQLDGDYESLQIMSLEIDQKNAYRLHTSNYGVIAGRVLANDAFGIPNAKISVFINIDDEDINDVVKSVLYPYNTTKTQDKNNIRYNLFPNKKVSNCHTVIGTFPEKQYMLDNDSMLEVFEKYYKFTTRTNNSGDYMIFGVPTGSQTIHVDIDLSDIGILSQKPRDMVYKGYNIEQFDNPNKFKHSTNLDSLTQVISQDTITNVIPFWGDESEGSIGITRCDVNVQYKFEPTCVFMGSVVSDTKSNGISRKCIPTPGMGAMDEITTGSGTIEMIRKTPSGDVEEFQIKGTQLIDGNGIWCYQIPMNLDYMMTDEFGNMVPTNDPNKGIPTRTKVRFRISMQDFDSDNANIFRCKMLVPHNPNVYLDTEGCDEELDYQFGTNTKDSSYRDLFWNCVYTVKSYIPRIQKGSNWKNEKFTGFKRVNYYNDKNPLPYNNIRIRIPFMYSVLCILIKFMFRLVGFFNKIMNLAPFVFTIKKSDDDDKKRNGSFVKVNAEICDENLEDVCIIPGIDIVNIAGQEKSTKRKSRRKTLLGNTIITHFEELGNKIAYNDMSDTTGVSYTDDKESIDYKNKVDDKNVVYSSSVKDVEDGDWVPNWLQGTKGDKKLYIKGVTLTNSIDYIIQCVEMNLAQEFKVIQFDFYNDWINGLIYIPRWVRNIKRQKSYLWGAIKIGKNTIKACNENYSSKKRNIVQQCGLSYNIGSNQVSNLIGCSDKKLRCHKSKNVRKEFEILKNTGIVKTQETLRNQFVYYFKPYENSNGKNIRLFATDIVLLGTFNDCDIWGIPNSFTDLVSSTYQIPTNLALTDSDIEGNDYEFKTSKTNEYIYMYVDKTGIIQDIELNGHYTNLNQRDDVGNFTEMSGIDWGYTAALQKAKTETDLYKPGGHFLGLTCRNSETNIKTCVNLSRICELGVLMSQRQSVMIPKNDKPDYYALVPSGFISKDEISDTNYRMLFATMNKNRLRTVINEKNGYPMYDFEYVNPTNFSGELSDKMMEDVNMNRSIKGKVLEKFYKYDDDEYYKRTQEGSGVYDEMFTNNIMRTGEYKDNEYYKFRFGLTDDDLGKNSELYKRYLLKSGLGSNVYVSFPVYDNSYYFYFGLYDGKTALDEFKKTYYSVCEKLTELDYKEENERVEIKFLTSYHNGVYNDYRASGKISLKVDCDTSNGKVYTVTLKNNSGSIISRKQITSDNDLNVNFTGLVEGDYSIEISRMFDGRTEILLTKEIEVKKIRFDAEIKGYNFKKDATASSQHENFSESGRINYGGYITIVAHDCEYEYESGIVHDNVFDGSSWGTYVEKIVIVNKNAINNNNYNEKLLIQNNIQPPFIDGTSITNKFSFKNNSGVDGIVTCEKNSAGEYMIPVPKADDTYSVFIKTYVNADDGKLIKKKYISKNDGEFDVEIGGDIFEKLTETDNNIVDNNDGGSDDFITFTNRSRGLLGIPEQSTYFVLGIDEISGITNDPTYWHIGDVHISNASNMDILYNDISYKNVISKLITKDKTKNNVESEEGWWTNFNTISGITSLDNLTQWKLKENLFYNKYEGSAPHTIKIEVDGGSGLYTTKITEGLTDQNPDLNTVNNPTVYFNSNDTNKNFAFQIIDGIKQDDDTEINGQIYPHEPFIIPVIYKPFFMEMCSIYMDNTKKYYIYGDVYNGKTWDYKNEGFNDNTFNKLPLTNLFKADDFEHDFKFSISNDIKYNGRKLHVSREIEPISYGINGKGDKVIDLSIGCKHIEENVEYSDYSRIVTSMVEFFTFNIIVEKSGINTDVDATTTYKIKMEANTTGIGDCILYPIFEPNELICNDGYKYPYLNNNNELIIDSNLFNDIIYEDKLIEYKNHKCGKLLDEDGFYEVKNVPVKDLTHTSMYYIAVPSNLKTNTGLTTNCESRMKAISISSKIDLVNLHKFYPLNLKGEVSDAYNSMTNSYATELTIKWGDDDSVDNYGNKFYKIYLYKNNSDAKSPVLTLEGFSNPNSKMTFDITPYRNILGLKVDKDGESSEQDSSYIFFNYDVYIDDEVKAPARYNMVTVPVTFKRVSE